MQEPCHHLCAAPQKRESCGRTIAKCRVCQGLGSNFGSSRFDPCPNDHRPHPGRPVELSRNAMKLLFLAPLIGSVLHLKHTFGACEHTSTIYTHMTTHMYLTSDWYSYRFYSIFFPKSLGTIPIFRGLTRLESTQFCHLAPLGFIRVTLSTRSPEALWRPLRRDVPWMASLRASATSYDLTEDMRTYHHHHHHHHHRGSSKYVRLLYAG